MVVEVVVGVEVEVVVVHSMKVHMLVRMMVRIPFHMGMDLVIS